MLVLGAVAGGAACKPSAPNAEATERYAYVERISKAEDAGALWELTSNDRIFFDEGWYPLEKPEGERRPPEPWRWMGRRGLLRIRTRREAQVVRLTGWVPLELLGAPPTLTYRWQGLVRHAEIVPAGRFTREILLPAAERSGDWGDLMIESSHAGSERTDPRELGFALTSIVVSPAQ